MVEHLVFFKLKEGVSEEDKAALMDGLRALPEQIDEIQHLACGLDFSGRSKGYEIGLVVRFENRQGLEIYQPHPAHLAFVEGFRHLWTDVMALDFETA
jgi:hypothetical protein